MIYSQKEWHALRDQAIEALQLQMELARQGMELAEQLRAEAEHLVRVHSVALHAWRSWNDLWRPE